MTTRYCYDFSYVNVFRTVFLKKIATIFSLGLAKNLIPKRLSSNRRIPKKIAQFLPGDSASIGSIPRCFRFVCFFPLHSAKQIPFRLRDCTGKLDFEYACKDVPQAGGKLEDGHGSEGLQLSCKVELPFGEGVVSLASDLGHSSFEPQFGKANITLFYVECPIRVFES